MNALLKKTVIIIFVVAMVFPVVRAESIAEVVWVGIDEQQNQILYSHYADKEWSQPNKEIYRSESSITTPFLLTQTDGSKLLLWSESRGASRMVLMMMEGQILSEDSAAELSWSSAKPFADTYKYNVGAVAAIDGAGHAWVFWVAEDNDDSDVLYSYNNGLTWSKPMLAHQENKVPELNPMVELREDGDIELSWSTYSYQDNDYVIKTSRLKAQLTDKQLDEIQQKLTAHKDVSTLEVPHPSFVPVSRQLIRLHYPQNRKRQFINLKD